MSYTNFNSIMIIDIHIRIRCFAILVKLADLNSEVVTGHDLDTSSILYSIMTHVRIYSPIPCDFSLSWVTFCLFNPLSSFTLFAKHIGIGPSFLGISYDFYCRWRGACSNFSFVTTRIFQVLTHLSACEQVIRLFLAAKVFEFIADHIDEQAVRGRR